VRALLLAGALLAGSAVALGAFGAHALDAALGPRQDDWWDTAVQYQMWHGLAVLFLAAIDVPRRGLIAALLGGGALLFAGSLYLLALSGWRWLGPVTPIGGLAMIAGWFVLAWSAWRGDRGGL
jgi:uncharacterized membrane protein YgdD (TMEM256/DUF423 family)